MRPVVQPRLLRVVVPVPGQRRDRPARDRHARLPLRLATSTTTTSTRAGCASTVDKDATVLLPDYPLDDLQQELHDARLPAVHRDGRLRAVRARRRAADHDHARSTRPTDGPLGDSALLVDDGETRVLNMNDSRPTDPDELLALGPLDVAVPAVLGRDLVPDGLRLPGPRPRRRSAHKKRVAQLGPRLPLHRDPRPRRSSSRRPGRRASSTTTCSSTTTSTATRRTSSPTRPCSSTTCARTGSRRRPADAARARRGELRAGSFEVTHPCRTPSPPDLRRPASLPRGVPGAEAAAASTRSTRAGGDPTPRSTCWPSSQAWFEPLLEQGEQICCRHRRARSCSTCEDRGDRPRLPRPEGPGVGTARRASRYHLPDRPRGSSSMLVRDARGRLGQLAVPVDALQRARGRARTTTTSTPGSSASTRSGSSTPRASTPSTGQTEGTFVIDGWEVQRRCPHMKADLTRFASIEDGVLTCALHGWQCELATGPLPDLRGPRDHGPQAVRGRARGARRCGGGRRGGAGRRGLTASLSPGGARGCCHRGP